tara:strand:+ start:1937 stop:2134 length:198 start_codon:yes stop_codon:yes gene_type:complete
MNKQLREAAEELLLQIECMETFYEHHYGPFQTVVYIDSKVHIEWPKLGKAAAALRKTMEPKASAA